MCGPQWLGQAMRTIWKSYRPTGTHAHLTHTHMLAHTCSHTCVHTGTRTCTPTHLLTLTHALTHTRTPMPTYLLIHPHRYTSTPSPSQQASHCTGLLGQGNGPLGVPCLLQKASQNTGLYLSAFCQERGTPSKGDPGDFPEQMIYTGGAQFREIRRRCWGTWD